MSIPAPAFHESERLMHLNTPGCRTRAAEDPVRQDLVLLAPVRYGPPEASNEIYKTSRIVTKRS